MRTHKDQFSNNQLPVEDRQLILKQHNLRNANHPHSEKSKVPLQERPDPPDISVATLYAYTQVVESCTDEKNT